MTPRRPSGVAPSRLCDIGDMPRPTQRWHREVPVRSFFTVIKKFLEPVQPDPRQYFRSG